MAEQAPAGNGNAFVYFIIGALVVGVAVLAYFAFAQNGGGGGQDGPQITIESPDISPPDDVDVEIDGD